MSRDCTLLAARVQLLCALRNRARRVLPPVAYVLCELELTIIPDPLPLFSAVFWGEVKA